MSSERGFTLTEILVATLLSAVLGSAALGFFRSQAQALGKQSVTLDATGALRAAMTLLTADVRGTAFDPKTTAFTVTGTKGVRYAGPAALWIELDRDGDGTIQASASDPSAESIVYSYDAGARQVVRTVAGVSQTVIPNVPAGTLTFAYFNRAGTALTPSGSPSVTVPAGYPSLPASVTQALTGVGASALSGANRDAIAIIRVTLQVQAAAPSGATLSLAARLTVPNRLLDQM
jgi:prepilin-type N-terminal cleavage/methylation domain-containing protein